MLVHRSNVRIQWGDCDPGGIVYFPRYLAMFDSATAALINQANKLVG
jgi:4-hydroxybenzoyl-CoA thioesterase